MKIPDLSIAIVSFNTRDLLADCLASVEASIASGAPLLAEVLVVDNASADGSAAEVGARFPAARLLANQTNVGFATACNQAIRLARGRYVLLLNPDTVVRRDALAQMVAFLDQHSAVGALGARLVYPDGSRQASAFRFPTLWMSFFDFFPINHRLANSRLNGRYPSAWDCLPYPIDHPLGACLMVRRQAIDQAGLLDDGFFMYCEEIDWCMRIKRAGWEICYTPSAEIVHYSAQSTRQFRGRMLVELHRSRFRLFRKHYGPAFIWAARRIVRLGIAREALRARLSAQRGELTEAELRDRLWAYGEILRM